MSIWPTGQKLLTCWLLPAAEVSSPPFSFEAASAQENSQQFEKLPHSEKSEAANFANSTLIKGKCHPKMKILSLFTQPHYAPCLRFQFS